MDSAMSVEIRNRREARLGIRLSSTMVWSHPTLTGIAAYLGEALEASWGAQEIVAPVGPVVIPAPRAQPASVQVLTADELAQHSEDELENALLEELQRSRSS